MRQQQVPSPLLLLPGGGGAQAADGGLEADHRGGGEQLHQGGRVADQQPALPQHSRQVQDNVSVNNHTPRCGILDPFSDLSILFFANISLRMLINII